MNISSSHFDDQELDPGLFERRASSSGDGINRPTRRREDNRRRRSAPQQFNGIHRRRRKKIRW